MAMPLLLLADECKCECGKTINREGYYLLTCKVGGGPEWSHNCMVSVWADTVSASYMYRTTLSLKIATLLPVEGQTSMLQNHSACQQQN